VLFKIVPYLTYEIKNHPLLLKASSGEGVYKIPLVFPLLQSGTNKPVGNNDFKEK
jgi:hypothetical protein